MRPGESPGHNQRTSPRFRGEGLSSWSPTGAAGSSTLTSTERCICTRRGSRRVCLQGRHDERTGDASALCADEGRGSAAISAGEPHAGCDPAISEWGNPTPTRGDRTPRVRRAPGELKHLSTPRKQEEPRSSGERTGGRPKPRRCLKPAGLAGAGLEAQAGRAAARRWPPATHPKPSGTRRQSA